MGTSASPPQSARKADKAGGAPRRTSQRQSATPMAIARPWVTAWMPRMDQAATAGMCPKSRSISVIQ